MKKRILGRNNLGVSAPGLGCMGMRFSYAPFPDRKEMISLIRNPPLFPQEYNSLRTIARATASSMADVLGGEAPAEEETDVNEIVFRPTRQEV